MYAFLNLTWFKNTSASGNNPLFAIVKRFQANLERLRGNLDYIIKCFKRISFEWDINYFHSFFKRIHKANKSSKKILYLFPDQFFVNVDLFFKNPTT